MKAKKPSNTPEIHILNEGEKFEKSRYKAVFSDYDKDGLPNLDDPNPTKKGDTKSVEERRITDSIAELLNIKNNLDNTMYNAVGDIAKISPKDAVIYARTKTPYSIIQKLIGKRLLTPRDPKKGLTDLIGMTIAVDNFADLTKLRNLIEGGKMFNVYEVEDFYKNPLDGYMAVHYILLFKDANGTFPVELQLKTKRMKSVNEVSHKAYAQHNLDRDELLRVTSIVEKADKGDATAIKQYNALISDKAKLEDSFFKDKAKKFSGGGGVDKEEWSEIGKENNRMLRNQVKEVAHHSSEINSTVGKNTKVEPWVVAKMERASTDLSDVTHYLDGNKFAGGGVSEVPELQFKQIASMTGMRETFIKDWATKNNLSSNDIGNLMMGLGRKQITARDFSSALLGKPNNAQEKKILAYAKSNKGYKMSGGGGVDESGLYDYKIGDFAGIRKGDYSERYGQIIDIRNFEMSLDLGQGIKGIQTDIYATIVDENGKEHDGELMPKKYSNSGSAMYAGGGDISKIKFTSGELEKLSKDYYNLYLYNNGERVYSATLPTMDAAIVADKYKNIKMKYAGGGKVGDDVFAYMVYNDDGGYDLVESPALGEVYEGQIIDIINENNQDKFVIKFENGKVSKLSKKVFDDYISFSKMSSGGSMYAGGGNVFVDKTDGTTYMVGKNAKGQWTVFSEGASWNKRDEFESGLASEQDAVMLAKVMAGVVDEFDPETNVSIYDDEDEYNQDFMGLDTMRYGGDVVRHFNMPKRYDLGGPVGDDSNMTAVQRYFANLNYDLLPTAFATFVKEEILNDPELPYLSEKEPIFITIKEKVDALQNREEVAVEVGELDSNVETQEAIDLLMELSEDQEGAEKQETLEAIELLKELLV